jgi:hypothetical protein
MNNTNLINSIKEMLDSADANIRSARQLLVGLSSGESTNTSSHAPVSHNSDMVGAADINNFEARETTDGKNRIIEGRFDGQNMIGPDKKSYPVPANYASKSKLVPGDILKLTIMPDGSFIYKQIGPVPRKRIIGSLCYEDGQYKVVAEGKTYAVLLASVTYFKAEIGDKVALIVPELEDSEWGAIENIVDIKTAIDVEGTPINLDVNDIR